MKRILPRIIVICTPDRKYRNTKYFNSDWGWSRTVNIRQIRI